MEINETASHPQYRSVQSLANHCEALCVTVLSYFYYTKRIELQLNRFSSTDFIQRSTVHPATQYPVQCWYLLPSQPRYNPAQR